MTSRSTVRSRVVRLAVAAALSAAALTAVSAPAQASTCFPVSVHTGLSATLRAQAAEIRAEAGLDPAVVTGFDPTWLAGLCGPEDLVYDSRNRSHLLWSSVPLSPESIFKNSPFMIGSAYVRELLLSPDAPVLRVGVIGFGDNYTEVIRVDTELSTPSREVLHPAGTLEDPARVGAGVRRNDDSFHPFGDLIAPQCPGYWGRESYGGGSHSGDRLTFLTPDPDDVTATLTNLSTGQPVSVCVARTLYGVVGYPAPLAPGHLYRWDVRRDGDLVASSVIDSGPTPVTATGWLTSSPTYSMTDNVVLTASVSLSRGTGTCRALSMISDTEHWSFPADGATHTVKILDVGGLYLECDTETGPVEVPGASVIPESLDSPTKIVPLAAKLGSTAVTVNGRAYRRTDPLNAALWAPAGSGTAILTITPKGRTPYTRSVALDSGGYLSATISLTPGVPTTVTARRLPALLDLGSPTVTLGTFTATGASTTASPARTSLRISAPARSKVNRYLTITARTTPAKAVTYTVHTRWGTRPWVKRYTTKDLDGLRSWKLRPGRTGALTIKVTTRINGVTLSTRTTIRIYR